MPVVILARFSCLIQAILVDPGVIRDQSIRLKKVQPYLISYDRHTCPYNALQSHNGSHVDNYTTDHISTSVRQNNLCRSNHAKIIGAISIHSICSYYSITTLCHSRNIIGDRDKVNHFQCCVRPFYHIKNPYIVYMAVASGFCQSFLFLDLYV